MNEVANEEQKLAGYIYNMVSWCTKLGAHCTIIGYTIENKKQLVK
jgi:hypothetical protein